jgi:hypothetical protein
MSVSFDWDFSEEPQGHKGDGEPSPPGRRRRLRRIIVLVALLALVGGAVGLWVRGRLDVAKREETGLRAVAELELETIGRGDAELFRTLQDPADPIWRDRQVARYFSPQAAAFAPAPGLVPSGRPTEIRQTHFFGQTGRVELVRWLREAAPSLTPARLLAFNITWFYRRDEDGEWYHTAPPDTYWGIPYSWHGSRLEIRSTEVEAAWIDAVADELAIHIAQGCRWLGCPEGQRYTLNFMDVVGPEVQGDWWALPALTLSGIPANSSAREAWRRALELWTVEALARTQVGDAEVTERILYQQLVATLKARLKLAEPLALDTEQLARAVRDGDQAPLWSLWQAKPPQGDPERNRILEQEVTALLQFMQEEVGKERILRLLPALDEYTYFSDAVDAVYDWDRVDFMQDWLSYMSDTTREQIAGLALRDALEVAEARLEPPPLAPPADPAGDQLAMVCQGRIWVGNADGSGVLPITAKDQQFNNPLWSPDGHWLLTTWHPGAALSPAAPYLLSADGREGRLLSDDGTRYGAALGWGPGGQPALYIVQYLVQDRSPEIHGLDLETNEDRLLPGVPVWSPDGDRIAYYTLPGGEAPIELWVADADWENRIKVVDNGWVSGQNVWSPDGSRLALLLLDESLQELTGLAVYDVREGRLSPPIMLADLEAAVRNASAIDVLDVEEDPADLPRDNFDWLWIQGWSADGSHLLVWAQSQGGQNRSTALFAIPGEAFDGASSATEGSRAIRVLAFGEYQMLYSASWSPSDPQRLAFTWLSDPSQIAAWGISYIFDLETGVVFTDTESWAVGWSPDGEWLAIAGPGRVTVVDKNGGETSILPTDGTQRCDGVVWNPAADLSGLGAGSEHQAHVRGTKRKEKIPSSLLQFGMAAE